MTRSTESTNDGRLRSGRGMGVRASTDAWRHSRLDVCHSRHQSPRSGLDTVPARGFVCGFGPGDTARRMARVTTPSCGRYWIPRAVIYYGGRGPRFRTAARSIAPTARPRDLARSAVQGCLSIRRLVPVRAAAGGRASLTRRSRCSSAPSSRMATGSITGHRLRALLVAARLSFTARRLVQARRGATRRPELAAWSGRHHDGGWRSRDSSRQLWTQLC